MEGGAWHFQNRTRKYQLQNTSHSHTRKGAEFNFFVHFSCSVLPMSKAFGNFFLPDPNCWLGSAKLLAASTGISPIFLWTTFISCNCFYFILLKIKLLLFDIVVVVCRALYFASPRMGSSLATSLMSAYYPVLLSGSSLGKSGL